MVWKCHCMLTFVHLCIAGVRGPWCGGIAVSVWGLQCVCVCVWTDWLRENSYYDGIPGKDDAWIWTWIWYERSLNGISKLWNKKIWFYWCDFDNSFKVFITVCVSLQQNYFCCRLQNSSEPCSYALCSVICESLKCHFERKYFPWVSIIRLWSEVP